MDELLNSLKIYAFLVAELSLVLELSMSQSRFECMSIPHGL